MRADLPLNFPVTPEIVPSLSKSLRPDNSSSSSTILVGISELPEAYCIEERSFAVTELEVLIEVEERWMRSGVGGIEDALLG